MIPECIDLRPYCKKNNYKWRYEESYKVEPSKEVKGDGRWYVEVLCKYGLIYPYGGKYLLAYSSRGKKNLIKKLPNVTHHQYDYNNEVLKFPEELLDKIASILQPRKRKIRNLTEKQKEVLRERINRARTFKRIDRIV